MEQDTKMSSEDRVTTGNDQSIHRSLKGVAGMANFMVFGQKKNVDPLEEFWMNKLSTIEKQYDDHMTNLEKTLLDNRFQGRFVSKQAQKIARQKQEIEKKAKENEKLLKKAKRIEKTFTQQKYEADSLKKKLDKKEELHNKTMQVLRDERFEKIRGEREISAMKFKLRNLERDKQLLSHDLIIKESEKTRLADKEANLVKQKWDFIRKLSQVDTERRVQTTANITLCESVGQLLEVGKSQEDRLIKQRRQLEDILHSMEHKKKIHEDAVRKLRIKENKITDLDQDTNYEKVKVVELTRQIKHWKEEFKFKELDASAILTEVSKLRNENSHLRCQLAKCRGNLGKIQDEILFLEKQKRKTEVELQLTKKQEKAVHMLMHRNSIFHDKLLEKLNHTDEALPRLQKDKEVNKKEIESYKKKIWDLERQKRECERKLDDSNRKENMMQVKLNRYSVMEEEIFWTEKAMMRLDGDQKRTKAQLKSLAAGTTKKIPFEKIVTDPSIMDRIMKHKVLQKRLLKQSAKIEELKSIASKLVVHKGVRSCDEKNRVRLKPQWKLSYWKDKDASIRDTNSEFDDGLSNQSELALPLIERDYYKQYMKYLEESIPNVKHQIFSMEKKQAQIVAKIVAEEQRQKMKKMQESLSDAETEGQLAKVDEEEEEVSDDENNETTEYDEEEEGQKESTELLSAENSGEEEVHRNNSTEKVGSNSEDTSDVKL